MAAASQHPIGDARRRLGTCALVVSALAAALVVSHEAGWPATADGDDGHFRLHSRAQAERCLTARGLNVTPAGARSLHVTGPAHLDVILTFYATDEQAQAIAGRWQSTPYGAKRPLQRTAFDNVTVRASSPLDDHKVRLLSGCVGRQFMPARPARR